jgi:predicted Mrr-cat superfamily restriction endonuclease
MEYLSDLSFSNIVKIIQKDEIKAKEVLTKIALEKDVTENNLEIITQIIETSKSRIRELNNASKLVAQHICRELPLTVQNKNYVIIVTEDNISIDRNVI